MHPSTTAWKENVNNKRRTIRSRKRRWRRRKRITRGIRRRKRKTRSRTRRRRRKKKNNVRFMNVWKKGITNDLHVGFTIGCQQALAVNSFSLPHPNFITGQFYLIFVPVHVFPLPVYPGLQVQRYEPIVLLQCAFIWQTEGEEVHSLTSAGKRNNVSIKYS